MDNIAAEKIEIQPLTMCPLVLAAGDDELTAP